MEKHLVEKQEALIAKYRELKKILLSLESEMVIRIAFAEVFSQEQVEGEPKIKPVESELDQRVHNLRELRLKAGIGQEKASIAIGKVPSFIGRLESGKIVRLDKPTENKLIALYTAKKSDEHKVD